MKTVSDFYDRKSRGLRFKRAEEFPEVGRKNVRFLCYKCEETFEGTLAQGRKWFDKHSCSG